MLSKLLLFQIILLCCKEYETFDREDLIIGNVRRRNILPLNKINRRWFGSDNLNYRRTKGIQDDIADKRIEWNNMAEYAANLRPVKKYGYNEPFIEPDFPEPKVDNDQLEKMHRDLRWLTINTDEGLGIGIR